MKIDYKDIKFKRGDLLIIDTEEIECQVIEKVIEAGGVIMAFNSSREIRKIMCKPIAKGLLIEGKEKILLVPREEMEYTRYDMKF